MRHLFFCLFCTAIPLLPVFLYGQDYPVETILQRGHARSITSVATSSDGRFVASGSQDQTAKLWEFKTGREIRTFGGHAAYVTSVALANGHKLITGAEDGTVRIWDIATGETLRLMKVPFRSVATIALSRDERFLAAAGMEGKIYVWDFPGGKQRQVIDTNNFLTSYLSYFLIKSLEFSPDGKFLVTAGDAGGRIVIWDVNTAKPVKSFPCGLQMNCARYSPDGRWIAAAGRDSAITIWDIAAEAALHNIKVQTDVLSMCFTANGQEIVCGLSNGRVLVWNPSSGELPRSTPAHEGWVNAVTVSADGRYILTAGDDRTIRSWKSSSDILTQTFAGKFSEMTAAVFSRDGNTIVTVTEGKRATCWDLISGKMTNSFYAPWNMTASPDGRFLASAGTKKVSVFSVATGQRLFTLSTDSAQNVFSSEGDFLLTINSRGQQDIRKMNSGNLVNSFHSGQVPFRFDLNRGATSFALSNDSLVALKDAGSGKTGVINTHDRVGVTMVRFSLDGQSLFVADGIGGVLESWNTSTLQKTGTYGYHPHESYEKHTSKCRGHKFAIGFVTAVVENPALPLIASGASDGSIMIWNSRTQSEVQAVAGHPGWITSLAYSPDGAFLLSASKDATARIWEARSGELKATLVPLDSTSYAILSNDHFYTANKLASRAVHFVKGLQTYTFDNFDLVFNRPDIVVQRLGRAAPALVRAYKQAYLKRLKRMGFTEKQIGTDVHLPGVTILPDVTDTTSDRILRFSIEAEDSKYFLDRINVYVNDVPIFGQRGLSVATQKIRRLKKELAVTLNEGRNKIQVSVHNEKGVESLKETAEIMFRPSSSKNTRYVGCIGVSEYRNRDMNLRFASKDADDLAALFESRMSENSDIKVFKLLNQDVSRETVLNLKDSLMESNVDDEVILFVAGHGLLDDKLDWYFATHDMDFQNPSIRDELEGLLDGIPARKKLFMMDACHSGEVDKEESVLLIAENEKAPDNKVKSRAFKTKVAKKSGLGLQNSFELMQTLFADLQRGSGAQVIASASGAEYAFESTEWNNGVFTYALLEGLKTGNSDDNKDGQICVSELRDYVIENVRRLTQDKQNPTARRENIEFDFTVW